MLEKWFQMRYSWEVQEKLDKLKKIYNIKTNTKLLEHIVNLELLKHNIK